MQEVRVFTGHDHDAFMDLYRERASALFKDATACGLDELPVDWERTDQAITSTRGFFRIIGVTVRKSEKFLYGLPMIAHFTGEHGNVALVRAQIMGVAEPAVLVRFLWAPGNTGVEIQHPQTGVRVNSRVLPSPSFQASPANLRQSYDSIPLAELFADRDGTPRVRSQLAPEDGDRFFEKVNRYMIVDAENTADMKIIADDLIRHNAAQDFAWVTLPLLRMLFGRGYASGHLRSLMSLLV